MKKAQIEIAGLLVIVIIISIVLFFGLLFTAGGDEEPSQAEFFDLQIASTIMPTIMESSIDCKDPLGNFYTYKDLLDVCVTNPGYECGDNRSCDFLGEQINETLTKTLTKWGLSYSLNITYANDNDNNNIINPIDVNSCVSRTRNFIVEQLIIPTRRGTVIATFRLCQ